MPLAVTVLIPTHGRPELLGRTLGSLAECRLPEGYREAVVVENGSRAGAEAVVAGVAAAHPDLRLRYLHVERANKSHALNEALATVGGGLVVFFDDDVRLDPGVLTAYAAAAEGRDGGAFFGGPFGVDYEEAPPEWLISSLPFSARGYDFSVGERPNECVGFNWAAFVEDLSAVGGFDIMLGPGSAASLGEESELQSRLAEAGVQSVEVHGAWVTHYVPRERCSATWVARREWRHGVAAGQREHTAGANQMQLIKKGLRGVGRGSLRIPKQIFKRNKVGWWRTVYSISFYSGLLRSALGADGKAKLMGGERGNG